MDYLAKNFMVLNPEKNQILWIGSGCRSPNVNIGCSTVSPMDVIEVLGLKFDCRLKLGPHIHNVQDL